MPQLTRIMLVVLLACAGALAPAALGQGDALEAPGSVAADAAP